MSFITQRRMLGFKLESTPYSVETLADADFDLCAWEIAYDADIAMMARKCAKGNFGKEVSISGKRKVTISFVLDLQEGADIATAPTSFKCFQACGMSLTTNATLGVHVDLDSDYSNVPATIEVVEKDEGTTADGVVVRGRGMMGNARLAINSIGEPTKAEFEFQGALDAIEKRLYAAMPEPTGFDTAVPDAVMGVTLSAFGDALTLDKVTIDLGNDVQTYTDPSQVGGVSGAHVVDRNPTVEVDPDLVNIDVQDWFGRWTGNTEGALLMEVGDNTQVSSSSLQVNKAYAPADREGHVTNTISYVILDDDLRILQGAAA